MNIKPEGLALAGVSTVTVVAIVIACECKVSYGFLESSVVESDIEVHVVSEGYLIDDWDFKIYGSLEGYSKDIINISNERHRTAIKNYLSQRL